MTRGFAVVLTLLVVGFVLFTAWWSTRRTDYFPAGLQSTFTDCESRHGWRDRQPVLSDFSDDWYSGVLSDFEEPSLYRRSSSSPRSVRFTWIRSFHDPIVVRADSSVDGRWRLTAKQNSVGAVFNPEPGVGHFRRLDRLLTKDEAEALDRALVKSRLFDLPSKGCQVGLDGAQWVLEGADPVKGFHLRDFQSPQSGPERDLGLFLLALTGWNVDRIY